MKPYWAGYLTGAIDGVTSATVFALLILNAWWHAAIVAAVGVWCHRLRRLKEIEAEMRR